MRYINVCEHYSIIVGKCKIGVRGREGERWAVESWELLRRWRLGRGLMIIGREGRRETVLEGSLGGGLMRFIILSRSYICLSAWYRNIIVYIKR